MSGPSAGHAEVFGLRLGDDGSGVTQPVSGTVTAAQATAANLNATVVGTGTFAVQAAQSGTWTVQPGNTANTTAWLVKEARSSTATNANVTASASSVTIRASSASRLHLTVYNDSSATLYLNLAGDTASTTNYTLQVPPFGYYEIPGPNIYTGTVTGIWSSATGAARVTELT